MTTLDPCKMCTTICGPCKAWGKPSDATIDFHETQHAKYRAEMIKIAQEDAIKKSNPISVRKKSIQASMKNKDARNPLEKIYAKLAPKFTANDGYEVIAARNRAKEQKERLKNDLQSFHR